ncbi:ABC transporter substrate-binding protein [Microbacterium mitrae]|uniref:ABC transporter substrate-binding protein n=1 Tax=Microbacterium mitrae TaxID=664640 RepID=A0A5C8HR12_9MICO|nr:ABC transporter substrate-binding protein [Microbacterium mitrae]TXK06454.1 ABC transporter substrate-binding protein [Microbacterium mitrae]
MNRTRKTLLAASAAALLVLTGCGAGDTGNTTGGGNATAGAGAMVDDLGFAVYTGDPVKGGTVIVLSPTDFSHLDPAMGNDGGVNNFYQLIYRQLTTYKFEPGMASPEVVGDLATDAGTPNEDFTEWTFTLKDGIKYQDGTEIVAADIKYALERSMDQALRVGSDFHIQYIKGAKDYEGIYKDPAGLESITVNGDKEITFTLEQPLASFSEVAAMQMFTPFPKDQIATTTQLDEMPIASGPYQVDSYTRGSKLELVRNEEWDPATDEVRMAYPDGFEFQLGLDQNTIDQRLLAGQGDDKNAISSSSLLAANVAKLQAADIKARTVRDIPNCTTYMTMNTTEAPFDKLEVRQAVNYAVDKQSVITATGGPAMASVATDMLLPSIPGWEDFDTYPSTDHKGDVAKAKELLAEAGYADGFEVTMDVRALPKWQAQAESVQASLAKVGIDVKLNIIDASTYYEVIYTPTQANPIAITGWCGSWLNGDGFLSPLFSGNRIYETGNYNNSQLNDPSITERLDAASVMTDPEAQQAEYVAIDKAIMDLAPVVPLVRDTPLQMTGSNVGGAFSNPAQTGYIYYANLGLKEVGE